MLCKKVIPKLSEFFDEALDTDTAIQISQHLGQCINCRREFDSIADLHKELRSLNKLEAPKYLHSLVQHRLNQQPWRERLRNELERYWSIIRTTEGVWYATRALGTLMAAVFILTMSTAITPFYVPAEAQVTARAEYNPAYSQDARLSIAKTMGVPPTPAKVVRAAISDLYLLGYGDSISTGKGKDDTFSVVTEVDRSGLGKVQRVLEHPADGSLLTNFNQMIASTRFRPASVDGQAVRSTLVFTFSKVFVSD